MKTSTIVWAIIIIIVIIGGAWFLMKGGAQPAPASTAGEEGTQSPEAAAPGTPTPGGSDAGAEGTSMDVGGNLLLGIDSSGTHGTHLIGENGMTLYTYSKDTAGVSNCSGACAQNWPPYTIASADALAHLEAGVSGKAGTITRADGRMQVTYNGMPLYFWVQDKQSGDVTGDGVGGFAVAKP